MSKLIFSVALAVAIAGGAATAQDRASQKFITEAMQGNLAEVQVGKLAQQNGQSDGVKSFGQMLQSDHGSANDKLTPIANAMNVTPPTEPSAKQKATYDKLSKLSGAAFDRAFVKEMVSDHKHDIQAYQKQAKKNDQLGNFAKDTLPTLQHHLQTAQSLQSGKSAAMR